MLGMKKSLTWWAPRRRPAIPCSRSDKLDSSPCLKTLPFWAALDLNEKKTEIKEMDFFYGVFTFFSRGNMKATVPQNFPVPSHNMYTKYCSIFVLWWRTWMARVPKTTCKVGAQSFHIDPLCWSLLVKGLQAKNWYFQQKNLINFE